MAKIYNHNPSWINHRYIELGMDKINKEKHKLMSNNIPWMLDAGYTLDRIRNQLGLSTNALKNWIKKNKGCNIAEYRKIHNIKLNRTQNTEIVI